jgi:hypothetical protein
MTYRVMNQILTLDSMAQHLRDLRRERRISKRQLADTAGVNVSVVHRAENGGDAKLSTWIKLFEGLGWYLLLDSTEQSEEASGVLSEENERRRERRLEGLIR